jgi:hypothetical protein
MIACLQCLLGERVRRRVTGVPGVVCGVAALVQFGAQPDQVVQGGRVYFAGHYGGDRGVAGDHISASSTSASRPGQYRSHAGRVADLSGRAGVLAEKGAEDRDRQRPWAGRGTAGSGGQLRSAALAGVRLWPAVFGRRQPGVEARGSPAAA